MPLDWEALVFLTVIDAVLSYIIVQVLQMVWHEMVKLTFEECLGEFGSWGILIATSLFGFKYIVHPDWAWQTWLLSDGTLAMVGFTSIMALLGCLSSLRETGIKDVPESARLLLQAIVFILLAEVAFRLLTIFWGITTNPILGQDWGRMIGFALICVGVVHGFFWTAARLPRVLRF